MKLEKKHWIIIGVVVAIIAVWYFFLRKKKAESGFNVSEAPCPDGCACVKGTINCVSESSWKPEYRSRERELAAMKGISLANISTFGTSLESSYARSGNPISDCMERCQVTRPREYCVSYCTGGQDTSLLAKTGKVKTGHVTVLKKG